MSTLRGVITDDIARQMQQRVEQRQKDAIAQMGQRYLLHPANKQQRLTDTDASRALR
jgi:hypothetical protein